MNDTAIHFPSLLLQVFLCGHQWFLHGFVLLSTSLFAYKYAVVTSLSGNGLAGNVVLLAFYAVLENTRLYQNSKGNKTKQRAPLVFAIALAVPALVCNSYLLHLQTDVLKLERAINSIAFVLVGMEVLLGTLTLLWLFKKSSIAMLLLA